MWRPAGASGGYSTASAACPRSGSPRGSGRRSNSYVVASAADSVVERGVKINQWRCRMAELPPPSEGMVLTHFIVSDDVQRSRRFYTEVLGGRVVFGPEPINVALSNSWIVINAGGGPTDDKPTVTLETPRDPDRVNSFNIRVKDIDAVYAEWSARVLNS